MASFRNVTDLPRTAKSFMAILLSVGLIYSAYFVLRFGGLWSENDTGLFSHVTTQMMNAGSVFFAGQYTHGYAYPAWLGSVSALTGMPVPVTNSILLPFVGVLFFVFLAYLVYREWLRTPRLAMLSVLLLFASPDLLFGLMRGNHEKLTIVLSLGAFYALMRGFRAMGNNNLGHYGAWALVLYLCVFTNATVNDYFASTFTMATAVAMVVGFWLARRARGADLTHRPVFARLAVVVAASWLLILWVMFFVFTPAGNDFRLLKTAISKVVSLFATLHTGSNPYTLATSQWANPTVVELLAGFRWCIAGSSFILWIWALWRVVVRRAAPSPNHLFLLALYGALGLTVAVAIPMDFAGLAAGANLEVRNFTFFVVFAAPVLIWGLSEGPARSLLSFIRRRLAWIQWLGLLAFAGFVAIGLLKVTLDPAISNQWMFYQPTERQAVQYFWTHARGSSLWTGPDNRIPDVWNAWTVSDPNNNAVVGFSIKANELDWLWSKVVVASAVVRQNPIPDYRAQNFVYNDGGARLYRVRPSTMFQN